MLDRAARAPTILLSGHETVVFVWFLPIHFGTLIAILAALADRGCVYMMGTCRNRIRILVSYTDLDSSDHVAHTILR